MDEIQIKTILYRAAWEQLGLSASQGVRKYIRYFLMTPQFKKGEEVYWGGTPLTERAGVPDDMQVQKYTVYLTQEFVNFLVERLEYEPETTPLTRGPNGEITG